MKEKESKPTYQELIATMPKKMDVNQKAILSRDLFNLCVENEGDHSDMQIIDVSSDDLITCGGQEFRIYHSERYCVEVSKKPIDESEMILSVGGFYYKYSSDNWEGYKNISVDEVLQLFKQQGL